ncbi:aminodeoxychorismate lyase [Streptosporangium jomthongense]|uniref:Aminotransferase class IV n=1 Tax=Marinobacter aromaticivorans TaxID=1494078 RepID=A0ABW2ISB1_9GAMM|nr:aminotransferase class IV [Marinobacter aromaticivorans]GGE59587.1 aminodeoxychorismate lyase [Streptosporangium jomthongense]
MFGLYWADEGGLPAGDRGAAYGDGLFETIRMHGDRGVLLSRHLERMVRDAGRLSIPLANADLRKACTAAIARYSGRFTGQESDRGWVLKLTLTRGEGGRGYQPGPGIRPNLIASASPLPAPPPGSGVFADFSRVPLTVNPLFAGIKSLNRLEQVMAAREIEDDLFEVLMSDTNGDLIEGTRTNLLLKVREGWITPPVKVLAVAGILRQWLLERLRARGESVMECALSIEDVMGERCQGLYLLNSVMGVVPVRRLAGQDLPADDGLATIFNPLELLE